MLGVFTSASAQHRCPHPYAELGQSPYQLRFFHHWPSSSLEIILIRQAAALVPIISFPCDELCYFKPCCCDVSVAFCALTRSGGFEDHRRTSQEGSASKCSSSAPPRLLDKSIHSPSASDEPIQANPNSEVLTTIVERLREGVPLKSFFRFFEGKVHPLSCSSSVSSEFNRSNRIRRFSIQGPLSNVSGCDALQVYLQSLKGTIPSSLSASDEPILKLTNFRGFEDHLRKSQCSLKCSFNFLKESSQSSLSVSDEFAHSNQIQGFKDHRRTSQDGSAPRMLIQSLGRKQSLIIACR